VLLAFVVWSVGGEAVRLRSLGPEVLDDFAILQSLSRVVVAQGGYSWQLEGEGSFVAFVYGPFAVLVHVALGGLGPAPAALVWMALLVVAAITCLVVLREGADPRKRPISSIALLVAVVSVRPFLQADLHFLNGNLIALALALSSLAWLPPRRTDEEASPARTALCGALLAASLAMKPVAVLLPLLLVMLRRFDALGWTLVFGACFFVVVPAAAFGPGTAMALSTSWLSALWAVSQPDFVARIDALNISLASSLLIASPAPAAGRTVLLGLQGAWLAGVGWALCPRWRRSRIGEIATPWGDREVLRDAAILLIAPLPLSSLLQPHQAVVVLPAAALLAMTMVEEVSWSTGRWRSLLALSTLFVTSSWMPAGGTRGLAIFASLVLVLFAAAMSRPEGMKNPSYS
jgi:hypothetical protein